MVYLFIDVLGSQKVFQEKNNARVRPPTISGNSYHYSLRMLLGRITFCHDSHEEKHSIS